MERLILLALLASLWGCRLLVGSCNIPQYYCGSQLTAALQSVCKEDGFASHFHSSGTEQGNQDGIIGECCHNPCTIDQLKSYCKQSPKLSPKQKRSNDVVDNRTSRKQKRDSRKLCSCRRRRNRKRSAKNLFAKARTSTTPRSLTSTAKNTVTETPVEYFAAEYQYDDWQSPLYLIQRSPLK